MKNCENCNIEIDGSFGSGRFCSRKCACSFSTKEKRKEINEKVRKKLKTSVTKNCLVCEKIFETQLSRDCNYCSNSCSMKNRWLSDVYKKEMSDMSKERCSNINERLRMKNIGRMGGFGKKGYTNNGVRYESNLEKNCFEYLDSCGLKPYENYIPHKNIPNSSKVSDIYIVGKNLWVEIDGIDREKKKKWIGKDYEYWLEKIKIYKENNLHLVIIKNIEEFKKIVS